MSAGNLAGLVAANAKRAELRAQGIKLVPLDPLEKARRNPKSRALAFRAYWWDHFGCDWNRNSPVDRAATIRDYRTKVAGFKGKSLARSIKETCFNCVGGLADPGPKLRVRDCECRDCPLHPVRPWQHLSGRGRAEEAPQESFLTGN